MGCGSSVIFKETINTPEESKIGQIIDQIGLEEVDVREFVLAVKKYGYFGDLTEAQMMRISEKINYNPKNAIQKKFYSQFKTDDGKYNTKGLILAGIMLCQGKVKHKATMLYQYLDPDCNDKLEADSKDQYDFEKALDSMMDLAINSIVDLLDTTTATSITFQADQSGLQERYGHELTRLSQVMFDDPDGEIKLQEFINCFKEKFPWALSARGVRYTLHPKKPKTDGEEEVDLRPSIQKDDVLEIPANAKN